MFLYDGAIVPDPEGIITGGHNNTSARTVAYRQGETINTRALGAMFKEIIANNRAGGWRKLKGLQRNREPVPANRRRSCNNPAPRRMQWHVPESVS